MEIITWVELIQYKETWKYQLAIYRSDEDTNLYFTKVLESSTIKKFINSPFNN